MSLYAQEHLEFRGIPIDGNLTNFVSKMKSIGYTVIDEEDNLVFMKGKFTNRDVKLLVCSSVKTHTVWKVCVLFDEARSWSSLKSEYKTFKVPSKYNEVIHNLKNAGKGLLTPYGAVSMQKVKSWK